MRYFLYLNQSKTLANSALINLKRINTMLYFIGNLLMLAVIITVVKLAFLLVVGACMSIVKCFTKAKGKSYE